MSPNRKTVASHPTQHPTSVTIPKITRFRTETTYGLDLITQRTISGNVLNYYGHDGNGNTRYLTGSNAVISDTYVYDAFGTVITNTGSTLNNYRFTGEQFDPNLGFYYLRARYSNPNTGRFISRDSFAGNMYDPASLHRYTYCGNNPINCVDPSGKFTLPSTLIAIRKGRTL